MSNNQNNSTPAAQPTPEQQKAAADLIIQELNRLMKQNPAPAPVATPLVPGGDTIKLG